MLITVTAAFNIFFAFRFSSFIVLTLLFLCCHFTANKDYQTHKADAHAEQTDCINNYTTRWLVNTTAIRTTTGYISAQSRHVSSLHCTPGFNTSVPVAIKIKFHTTCRADVRKAKSVKSCHHAAGVYELRTVAHGGHHADRVSAVWRKVNELRHAINRLNVKHGCKADTLQSCTQADSRRHSATRLSSLASYRTYKHK